MYVSPMLLNKVDHPFEDDSYITELKLDGIRIIWTNFNNKVRIYTRHNNEVTSIFPELATIDLPEGTVLDGEIVVPGDGGKPDFEAVMERFMSKKSNHQIQYCVFDIIYFNGEKVTSYSLPQRKELLDEIIPEENMNIGTVRWIYGNETAYFDLIKQNKLEGIVMKKAYSRYEVGKRSDSWLKVINYQYEDVFITGFRKGEFGLLLSFLNHEPAGMLEFMPPDDRKRIYSSHKVVSENQNFKFIEPIKCHVKYRNLTKQGKLRIPSFVEWL
ncbi:ATP-dependent DNA ligase [Virgibacillus salexigens]|uniref:Putative DNA ligase-like protein/MT0965 n=1 Tax=Virgibacillus massiliensis TaxID=1462526 RepID=A0A024QIF7_9BACI|nr:RNA ligase family protein [Virgibacillus massiliensis]CDQ41746.1 Putative DNA ligase-like protein/MT0965 [Virgibacillus massiliensis]